MKRYLPLAAGILAAALALALFSRLPHAARPAVVTGTVRDTVLWTARISSGGLDPDVFSAAKGARAVLRLSNEDSAPHTLVLLGYEDLLPPVRLAPGERATVHVDLDRPADDLAFQVDGKRAGRVAVLGSHLMEGHQ